jgi:hypothetical protein
MKERRSVGLRREKVERKREKREGGRIEGGTGSWSSEVVRRGQDRTGLEKEVNQTRN